MIARTAEQALGQGLLRAAATVLAAGFLPHYRVAVLPFCRINALPASRKYVKAVWRISALPTWWVLRDISGLQG
jgi:hypothetical protein